jgi:hypothetical protein
MRPRSSALVLVVFICSASLLASQTQTVSGGPAPRSAQALSTLHSAMMAFGERSTTTDVTLSGKARRLAGSIDETGTAVLKALATGETRLDFDFPSGAQSEVILRSPKGPVGQWSGPDGKVHEMKQHNLATDAAWFFPVLFLRRAASSAEFGLAHLGTENRDGKVVEHLSTTRQFSEMPPGIAPLMESLSQSEVYLDAATLLPASITFNTHPDNDALRKMPTEIRFSDYRSVNGTQVPHHVQKYVNGGLVLDLQFDTVSLNTGLSSRAFNLQ